MSQTNYLTVEDVLKYLRYDKETGNFYWIADTNIRGPSKIGTLAGAVNTAGYVIIQILGCKLYAHQLVWFIHHGYIPEYTDHKNCDRADNRLCNLREATQGQNLANRDMYILGYEIHGAKFRARIDVNGIRHELGSFDTADEAQAAYHVAADKFYGEFAAINRE